MRVEAAASSEVIDVRHQVLRSGRPRNTAIFAGDHLPSTRHWVAREDGQVIGVVSVMAAPQPDGEARWQLRGMAVLPDLQGRGIGRALLDAVHHDLDAALWCNARAAVVPFYARAGWEIVGEPFDVPPIGLHVRMLRPASAINR